MYHNFLVIFQFPLLISSALNSKNTRYEKMAVLTGLKNLTKKKKQRKTFLKRNATTRHVKTNPFLSSVMFSSRLAVLQTPPWTFQTISKNPTRTSKFPVELGRLLPVEVAAVFPLTDTKSWIVWLVPAGGWFCRCLCAGLVGWDRARLVVLPTWGTNFWILEAQVPPTLNKPLLLGQGDVYANSLSLFALLLYVQPAIYKRVFVVKIKKVV